MDQNQWSPSLWDQGSGSEEEFSYHSFCPPPLLTPISKTPPKPKIIIPPVLQNDEPQATGSGSAFVGNPASLRDRQSEQVLEKQVPSVLYSLPGPKSSKSFEGPKFGTKATIKLVKPSKFQIGGVNGVNPETFGFKALGAGKLDRAHYPYGETSLTKTTVVRTKAKRTDASSSSTKSETVASQSLPVGIYRPFPVPLSLPSLLCAPNIDRNSAEYQEHLKRMNNLRKLTGRKKAFIVPSEVPPFHQPDAESLTRYTQEEWEAHHKRLAMLRKIGDELPATDWMYPELDI